MKRLILITIGILGFTSLSSARVRMVKTTKAYKILPKDGGSPMITVTGQKLELKNCKRATCIVEYKGETFSLPRLDLRSTGIRAKTTPSLSLASATRSQTTSSELGGGSISNQTLGQQYFRSTFGSSRYLSCYSRNQNKYTSILYCKNKNGARYACGSKPVESSRGLCYKGVKNILLKCGSSTSYLPGANAKNAGSNLVNQGFKKLEIKDPRRAPLGSVIVYDNACTATNPAGHIEVKVSETKWVSDFITTAPINEKTRCRPVKAIYYK